MNLRFGKKQATVPQRSSQEGPLLDYLRELKRHTKGRHAVHLKLSRLNRQNRQPQHRRMIAGAFNGLIKSYESRIFWMDNFDLIFIGKDCSIDEITHTVLQIRQMFRLDHAISDEDTTDDSSPFCNWYDLETQFNDLLTQMMALHEANKHLEVTEEDSPSLSVIDEKDGHNLQELVDHIPLVAAPPSANPAAAASLAPSDDKKPVFQVHREAYGPKAKTIKPMGPIELDRLERALESMDMTTLIRQQKACAILPGQNPHPIFVENFVSIEEISQQILPGYNLHDDRWLFQRLTRILDRKVMFALTDMPNTPQGVFSINANVETVLSTSFIQFREKMQRFTTRPLVLEFKLFDVIADMRKFLDAQDRANKMGCKVALDGMDFYSFLSLDRRFLNVDFYKISWNPDFGSNLVPDLRKQITDHIHQQGAERVILCHCSDQASIKEGRSLGIHLFQGYGIDSLL